MSADPGPTPEDHALCDVWLFDVLNAAVFSTGEANPMHGLPGGMAVSTELPAEALLTRYAPRVCTCPHGGVFYAYPNAELVAALDAL